MCDIDGFFKCAWVSSCPKPEEPQLECKVTCKKVCPAPKCSPCPAPKCETPMCFAGICCPEKKEEKKCGCDGGCKKAGGIDFDRHIKCACKDGKCMCYKKDKDGKWERYMAKDPHHKAEPKLEFDRHIKCACKDGKCVCYKKDKDGDWERYFAADPHYKKAEGCDGGMVDWPKEPWF